MGDPLKKIRDCLIDLDEDCVVRFVKEALSSRLSATEIVLGPMSAAMEEIGRLYEEGEYFIAELIEAADIFKKVMGLLRERLREEASQLRGKRRCLKVVIGTVKGDIHDIGKTLVAVMLQAAGHEVIDLGVDVDAGKFIDAVVKYGAEVLGMSALLTSTAKYMKEVLNELEKRGLRSKVFVIIGGAATTPEFAEEIGADAWAKNAVEAVKILNELAEGRRDSWTGRK
ncbi:MAG: corrinoid protein [Desulfurococcales archaeon]|nr:corrinoid protein [Desulfurococcales archaeon]